MTYKVLIVQPWFTAQGHPPQSTINTAQTLLKRNDIYYLISKRKKNDNWSQMAERLKKIAPVETFNVPSSSLKICTLLALFKLIRLRNNGLNIDNIFFLDGHLVVLAIAWSLVRRFLKVQRLSLLNLRGPEQVANNPIIRFIVLKFLMKEEVRLFLRTDELVDAWQEYFPEIKVDTISILPSLELPENCIQRNPPNTCQILRFGIIGQVRMGKSIEHLVPIFQNNPELGILTIAGTFFDSHKNKKSDMQEILNNYPFFINKFLSEVEMEKISCKQDYLLMLYDKWDKRMEAATLYLAARINRPVIVYKDGWCGRMVETYGCGLFAPKNIDNLSDYFRNLPRPGTVLYSKLLAGLELFRIAHNGDTVCHLFIKNLIREEAAPVT